jgi:subtilisin family serine protease
MIKISKTGIVLLFLSLGMIPSYSQSRGVTTIDSLPVKYLNWYNRSPSQDKIQGAATDQAYRELLNDKSPRKKVVVAVIDGGVDIYHPELEGKIWTNKKEIAGNGLDDDNNGYVDDIHGWNFIGNSKGEHLLYENMEYVRIFKKLNPRFSGVKDENGLPADDKQLYAVYVKSKIKYEEELRKYTRRAKDLESFERYVNHQEEVLKKYLRKQDLTAADVRAVKTKSEMVNEAKKVMLDLYDKGFTRKDLSDMQKRSNDFLTYYLNLDFNPRMLVNDDPENISDLNYGNNDVKGPRSFHGTFVAGVIAAIRGNGQGPDGVANHVEIMTLRVVPDGDERDKDVALAIRYAVDNGADIINMSFGKYFSITRGILDDAVRYAGNHNVLMIHSAGNEADNLDLTEHYPSAILADGSKVSNWITVGATSDILNKEFCGVFSNYGAENVDLFAPGVNIVSLAPDGKYEMGDGTSFSGPVVSGVAALVWSYYPELTAIQLKDILLESSTKYPKAKVYSPDTKSSKRKKVQFATLSRTGGVVNAYNALQAAGKAVLAN